MEYAATLTEKSSSSILPIPTTSVASRRYDNTKTVTPTLNHFSSSLFEPHGDPEPNYLPQNWSSFTHPEGQLYFFRNGDLRIVTEAHLYQVETAERVARWVKWFDDEVSRRGINVPKTVELFLSFDEGSEGCEYYFVDHATRTEFWLTQLPTQLLGLPAAVSPSHTQLVLEEHYWNHVQYFPMHFGGLKKETVDELIGIFVHGQADQLTSDVSTFPFNADKCSQFLTLLRGSKGDTSNGHITCVAARLFGFVTASRFSSLYGQENARLSRDQSVFNTSISERHWTSNAASRLLLGAPTEFSTRFKDLYVDKLVYIDQWQAFVVQCVENWKLHRNLSLSIMITSLLISLTRSASHIVTFATFIACISSILSAEILARKHSNLSIADATDAANYLSSLQSEKHGFQFAAIVYSLPQAFVSWSVVLLLAQGLFVGFETVGPMITVLSSVFVIGLIMTVRLVVTPSESHGWCSVISWPRSLPDAKLSADEKV